MAMPSPRTLSALIVGLLVVGPATAQDTSMGAAQFQIANQLLAQQQQQIIQLGAQVILLQQENAKLKSDLEATKKPTETK